MGGGRVQAGLGSELLQVYGRCVPGERSQQAHHALNDLDRRLGSFLLCHGRELREKLKTILQYEIGGNNLSEGLRA
jgi:hypothetical protein